MNTISMFDLFFQRILHTLSPYMWGEAQFQHLELFSAFCWGELRSAWTVLYSGSRPAASYMERHLPFSQCSGRIPSPCETFSLPLTACQAEFPNGEVCNRRSLPGRALCRSHAERWMFPVPFPYGPTAGYYRDSFPPSFLCVFLTFLFRHSL